MTIEELIDARHNGSITTTTMMEELLKLSISDHQHDPTGGDGFISGDWRYLEKALMNNKISNDEYILLATRHSGNYLEHVNGHGITYSAKKCFVEDEAWVELHKIEHSTGKEEDIVFDLADLPHIITMLSQFVEES